MNEHQQPSEPTSQSSGQAAQLCQQIYGELRKVFFGQDHVVSQVLAALLAGGHILLEGKPGLGKPTLCWH